MSNEVGYIAVKILLTGEFTLGLFLIGIVIICGVVTMRAFK
jgi:hypothetical protein